MADDATTALVDYVDDPWPNPLTVPERIDWANALEGLDPEMVVQAVGAMTTVNSVERPPIHAFLAVVAGIKAAEPVVPTLPPEQRELEPDPTPFPKVVETIRQIREATGLHSSLEPEEAELA